MIATAIQLQPRVLLVQHGARHRYALAAALHRAGMLEAIGTDTTAYTRVGRSARLLSRVFRRVRRLQTVAARTVSGVPLEKIRSTDAVFWSDVFSRRASHPFYTYQRRHRVLSKRILRRGFGRANWLYVMYDEGLELLRAAKAQGLRTAVDVFVHPRTARLVRQEQLRFPDWPSTPLPESLIEQMESYLAQSLRLADLITCPSEWVAEGVVDLIGQVEDRIRVVPYGSSFEPAASGQPVPGRVLFAGADFFRKGLPYLGMAATLLRRRGRHYQFLVAGAASDAVINHPVSKDLQFLGKLSSEGMREQFKAADVFALPTLSEGLASVLVEAMSHAVPVVTTARSGAVTTTGVGGVLVPVGDSEALASAIEMVVEDRQLRERLASNALGFARQHFTLEAWSARLGAVFSGAAERESAPR